MLHYPFSQVEELLSVNRVVYSSYIKAFTACCQHHSHPEDYYVDLGPDPNKSGNSDDEDLDDLEPDPKVGAPLIDFEAYAQRWLDNLGQLDGLGGLRTHYLD